MVLLSIGNFQPTNQSLVKKVSKKNELCLTFRLASLEFQIVIVSLKYE